MITEITVRDLDGTHLGQRITITTANTVATGVLQGFERDMDAISDGTLGNPDIWVNGSTTTTITLLPGQDIAAQLGDEVAIYEPDVGIQFQPLVKNPASAIMSI